MKLKTYLDAKGIRYDWFATQIGLPYKSMWAYLNGKVQTLPEEAAKRVEELTDGDFKAIHTPVARNPNRWSLE